MDNLVEDMEFISNGVIPRRCAVAIQYPQCTRVLQFYGMNYNPYVLLLVVNFKL